MSQSMSIYRISDSTFEKLEASGKDRKFKLSSAKDDILLQGSFMGLEYVLLKGRDPDAAELIQEIFNPKSVLGAEELETSTPEEEYELYEGGGLIAYLGTDKIAAINPLLDKITADDIHAGYNAKELNENGIYPCVWHNDNSPDQAYNERQLQEDFEALKNIFRQAGNEKDYLLVYIG